jgi:plastocyanin
MRPARVLSTLIAPVLAIGFAGCGVVDDGSNLLAGKEAFVQKCGSCHKLQRAGTTGVSGPDLDAAFERALADGMDRSTVEGVVHKQIGQPYQEAQTDPVSKKPGTLMPANLVTGDLARDVAAYVAYASARKGEDTGRLAEVGVKKATGAAKAENGTLTIPADPGGALAYQFAEATAPAGALTLVSPNEAQVPHNIAIEGGGINEEGPVVQGGGKSEIKLTLKAGEYTFFCSVPGHRDGGMEGKLTVE